MDALRVIHFRPRRGDIRLIDGVAPPCRIPLPERWIGGVCGSMSQSAGPRQRMNHATRRWTHVRMRVSGPGPDAKRRDSTDGALVTAPPVHASARASRTRAVAFEQDRTPATNPRTIALQRGATA